MKKINSPLFCAMCGFDICVSVRVSGRVGWRAMGGKGWLGDVPRFILREYRKCRTSDGGGIP